MKESRIFKWTVIGAGPAGIAAVGKLIDAGVQPSDIAWIDPDFMVGDFGRQWFKVISNTPVSMFLKFYHAFGSFGFGSKDSMFMIERLNADKKCPLGIAAEPLQWITNHLRSQVASFKDKVQSLQYSTNGLRVDLEANVPIATEKVILAIGAEPKTLSFRDIKQIPFIVAVNPHSLKNTVDSDDVVAVFGSYQSARTITDNLSQTNAKKVVHFYRSKRSFKTHVASLGLSSSSETHQITPENLLRHLPQCNKVIYAVGFEKRVLPIDGLADDYGYDEDTGQIAPGIFGIGIAFPEIIPHTLGREKYKVNAIYPILKHLIEIFPMWQEAPIPNIGFGENIHVHKKANAIEETLDLFEDENLEVMA